MNNQIFFFIQILILILILFFIYWLVLLYYFKFKSRFWYMQPVFHLYDFQYYFYNKGIIQKTLPTKNEYTDFKNTECIYIGDASNEQIDETVKLIQTHYFKNKKNKENQYLPEKENIIPYLHNSKSLILFYFNDIYLNLQEIKKEKKIIGTMTGVPLKIYIKQNNINFELYYVDNLCVNKQFRGKKIAEKIIQTYEYTCRHLNKNIFVHLFKREDELTGIIPLCIYKSFVFDMKNWKINNLKIIHPEYKILYVNQQNIFYFYDFLMKSKNKYEISIIKHIADIQELIKTKNIFIQMILKNNEIIFCYFYKKLCTYITKETQFLSLYASINFTTNKKEQDLFIEYFKITLNNILINNNEISKENEYSHLIIEDISDNNLIIKKLKQKKTPISTMSVAYFFYNYAYQTLPSNKLLILV